MPSTETLGSTSQLLLASGARVSASDDIVFVVGPGALYNPVAARAITRMWESTLNAHVSATITFQGAASTEIIEIGTE